MKKDILKQGSHPSDHMENKDLLRTFLAFTRTLEGRTQSRASYLPALYFRRLLRNKPEDELLIWSATVFVSILSQRILTTTDHSTRINILSTFKHLNFFIRTSLQSVRTCYPNLRTYKALFHSYPNLQTYKHL